MSARDGGPAFPTNGQPWCDPEGRPLDPARHGWLVEPHGGASLRDHFAIKALAGLIASPASFQVTTRNGTTHRCVNASDFSQLAYVYADAMLAAREVQS